MQNYTKYTSPARKTAFFLLFLREKLRDWGKIDTFAPLFTKHVQV
jgi:hypothetical protein